MSHLIAGLTDPNAGASIQRHGPSPAAAAAQAEAVFDRLHADLAAINCVEHDVCKITMRITDREWREPVYAVLGRRLAGVFPVSTGLIVERLADPNALFQLDVYVVPGGPHERLRRYRSSDGPYGLQRQAFSMDFCMVVQAGREVFLRGQTGSTLDRRFPHLNDPAAQIRQAIANIRELLADVGAGLQDTTQLMTYATDPSLLAMMRETVRPAFVEAVDTTELLVKGLAAPELLLEIDVIATLPD
jgi:enamine deaminase RidA (YjgF/YER057c/UK114 family)